MGNVIGRTDGEGAFGVYGSEEGFDQRSLEIAQSGSSLHQEPLVHSPPPGLSPCVLRSSTFNVPVQTDATDFIRPEKRRPVMFTWSHGGEKVAISGSWDDWQSIEPMQRSGKDFILMKVLDFGTYHFWFIVDGHLRCDPDSPCDLKDPCGAYNIMDVKECAAESRESISDFELPPSPDATYSNNSLADVDSGKPPPSLPPQLHRTVLNETAFRDSYHLSLSRPELPVLNHLYVKSWPDPGEVVALGSTHRFLEKYVTVVLYKPSWRHR